MNTKSNIFRFAAPLCVGGLALTLLSAPSLEKDGHFEYDPNPGAMAKSPFGRTVGMALQGPITRFWDHGVGSNSASAELIEANRPDEKLFNFVSELRDGKTAQGASEKLDEEYKDYAMARVEKKLSLAWKMDPRNFANYAIYQMFLWEGFNYDVISSDLDVRTLSLQTLETSLEDKESPVSLLTAGQAAYDLVFAARTSKEQNSEEAFDDINTYSRLLPQIIKDYDVIVSAMQEDGRWDRISEVKKSEFNERKAYLERLNQETREVVERLSKSQVSNEGGLNS